MQFRHRIAAIKHASEFPEIWLCGDRHEERDWLSRRGRLRPARYLTRVALASVSLPD